MLIPGMKCPPVLKLLGVNADVVRMVKRPQIEVDEVPAGAEEAGESLMKVENHR
jgi:hypothetical protein